MRAAVTLAPGEVAIRQVPEPAPGPGEALVQVEVVGICGSDLHFFIGDNPYANYPRTQGHEFCGIVRAFGPGYDGPIRVGDRVAVEPLRPCGTCFPCRHGRPNCCTRLQVVGIHVDGGMADLYAAPVGILHPTGALDPELAAMVEPVSIGLHAVVRGAVTAQDQVAVFGAGPIGQAVLLAAVDRGARVLVVDRIASRLELASALGAEAVVDAAQTNPAEAIAAWTGGDGPGIVFDATGVPAVIRSIFDIVAASGRIVIVGISTEEVAIPVIYFTRKELTILGSRNNVGIFGEAVQLVQRHQERVRRLITHRFPLDRVAEAFAFAHDHPAEAEKVLLLVGGAR
jgi:L-gulonate 5-dehydrogenase